MRERGTSHVEHGKGDDNNGLWGGQNGERDKRKEGGGQDGNGDGD